MKENIIIKIFFLFVTLGSPFYMKDLTHLNYRERTEVSIDTITMYDSDNPNEKVDWIKVDNIYYFFLPKSFNLRHLVVDFNDFSVSYVNIDNGIIQKRLYNKSENSFVMFENFLFEIGNQTYSVKILQSDIDSIFIDLDHGDDDYQNIIESFNHSVSKSGNAFVQNEKIRIEKMRGRGHSTWKRPKKPFQIKFDQKKSLFGMKEAKTWNLLTNTWDGSLSRNAMWFNLANYMDMEYTPEFKPVDLYINHKYKGSYLLTSKVEVKENRVEIGDNDFLIEISNHPGDYDFISKNGFQYKVDNPDASEANIQNIKEYIDHIETMIFDPSVSIEELEKYIDIDSAIQFYFIQEVSLNYDVLRGSNYFYMQDGKLHFGPIWDMDNTMNRSYNYAKLDEDYILNNSSLQERMVKNYYASLMKRNDYKERTEQYFREHLFLLKNIIRDLDDYHSLISSSADMNYTLFSYTNMKQEQQRRWIKNDNSFDDSYQIFRNSLLQRYDYLKKKYY